MNLTQEQIDEILKICNNNTHYMWGAKIVSIILKCDFRESPIKLREYFENKTEEE